MLLFATIRNIFQIDKSAKRTQCRISMTTLKTLIFLWATSTSTTIKRDEFLCFYGNNCYANPPQCKVRKTSILLQYLCPFTLKWCFLRRIIQSQSGTFLSVIMSLKLRRFCILNHLSNCQFHTSIFSSLLTEYKAFTANQPNFWLFRLPVSTQTHFFSLFY